MRVWAEHIGDGVYQSVFVRFARDMARPFELREARPSGYRNEEGTPPDPTLPLEPFLCRHGFHWYTFGGVVGSYKEPQDLHVCRCGHYVLRRSKDQPFTVERFEAERRQGFWPFT